MKRGFLTLLAAAALSTSAWASGYQVLLQSNRSTAMGNVGVGLRPDPSSINFNPGAMAMMRSNGVQLGANLIYADIAFRPDTDPNTIYRTDNGTGTPFHLFATFGDTEGPLRFGLGVYTPYGSGVNWGSEWEYSTSLKSIDLAAIFIQPTVSYKITDQLSVGAGLIYAVGSVNLQRNTDFFGNTVGAELDGSASGWGYNLGISYAPNDKLMIGLNYRSQVDMEVEDGEAIFTNVPDEDQAGLIPDQTSFSSTLPLPSYLTLGLSYKATDKLTLAADISRAGWDAYQSLTFTYGQQVGGSSETTAPRNYENSYTYKFGAEYAISDMFMLRAGTYYDESPVQDGYLTAETPDANTWGYTGGFGIMLSERFSIDASVLFINKEERENIDLEIEGLDNPIGSYKSQAFIPGITLTANF